MGKKEEPETHSLVIKVREARGLLAKDDNGYSDPLCEIKYGKLCAHTGIQLMTLEPKWNEVWHSARWHCVGR